MSVLETIITQRLLLEPLSANDANFILELVNTKDWLRFIGNKNISTTQDALAYIQKISANEHTNYWTVKLKDSNLPIGLVTLIKRDYLQHEDIGFAFLPNYFNKGFAYEATAHVLVHLVKHHQLTNIAAITIPENISSIKLLQKFGLKFKKEIEMDGEVLHLYEASKENLDI